MNDNSQDRNGSHVSRTLPADPRSARPGDDPTLPGEDSQSPTIGRLSRNASRNFGEYELIAEIARGGMGVVYKARQRRLNRFVALKMILTGQLASEADVKRFHAEAEAAANLDHPGIVPIFEIGEYDGHHYFSMALIEGTSLAARLADGPLPPNAAAGVVKKVAEAMAYAHEKGVIHRDLKPANVLLDVRGEPKVTDFGLAKSVRGNNCLTGTGQILGTPSFMSPEQALAQGGTIGPATDVYALGAILYCALTGSPPFLAATPTETVLQVLHQEATPIRRINPDLSRDLETICQKCLEKQPSKRYSTALHLSAELQRFLSGQHILARPVGRIEQAWRWGRRRPAIAGLLLMSGLMLLSATGATVFSLRADRVQREKELAERDLLRSEWKLYSRQLTEAKRDLEFDLEYLGATGANRSHYRDDSLTRLTTFRWDFRGWEHDFLFSWTERLVEDPKYPGFEEIENCVAVSRDLSHQVGVVDGWLVLTDSSDQSRTHRLRQVQPKTLRNVRFSPDGNTLATQIHDAAALSQSNPFSGEVAIWDVSSGRLRFTRRSSMQGIAFSPDGKKVAIAGEDTRSCDIRILDAMSGEERGLFAEQDCPDERFCFGPDGRSLISAGSGSITIWDIASESPTAKIPTSFGKVNCVTCSSDGKRIAIASGDAVSVWDLATAREELVLIDRHHAIYWVEFSPDNHRIVSCDFHGRAGINIWDAASGVHLLTLDGPMISADGPLGWFPPEAWFTTNGENVVCCSDELSTRVWSAPKRQLLTLDISKGSIEGLAFSPNRAYLATHDYRSIRFWDLTTGREHVSMTFDRGINYLSFSANGEFVALADGDRISILDPTTGQKLTTLPVSTNVPFVFHPDNCTIVTYEAFNGEGFKRWDFRSGRLIEELAIDAEMEESRGHHFHISPDGAQIVASVREGDDDAIRVWDLRTSELLHDLPCHGEFLAMSPMGSLIASSAVAGEEIVVWDYLKGAKIASFKGRAGDDITFSSDGNWIARIERNDEDAPGTNVTGIPATKEKKPQTGVRVWRVDGQSSPMAVELPADASRFEIIAFNPDGRGFAAVCSGRAYLWRDLSLR